MRTWLWLGATLVANWIGGPMASAAVFGAWALWTVHKRMQMQDEEIAELREKLDGGGSDRLDP